MRRNQVHFFATRSDLLEVLLLLESDFAVVYTLAGLFYDPDLIQSRKTWQSGTRSRT